jgi:hypothetical protein
MHVLLICQPQLWRNCTVQKEQTRSNIKRFITLTLRLLTGYKMYPGLESSWTITAGTEKLSYQFFYLFILVPLSQRTGNRHSAHILLFTCRMFFLNPTGPLCTQVSKNGFKYVLCQNFLHKSPNIQELQGHHQQPHNTADWLMSSCFAVTWY